jgi:formate C-acetyltransferase
MESAAIFYANPNESLMRRAARVARASLERARPPKYTGTHFYPPPRWSPALPDDDPNGHGLCMRHDGQFRCDGAAFGEFIQSQEDSFERLLLQRVARDVGAFGSGPQSARYAHGGMHWVANFPGLLGEGLAGYRARIERRAAAAETLSEHLFCEAMLDTVEGLAALAEHCRATLAEEQRTHDSPRLARLSDAFAWVPLHPARTFFEAMVSIRFAMGVGCGEPGRLDQYLWPFYARDTAEGILTREEALELLDEHFAAIDECVSSPGAWHLTLGGSDTEGEAAYNDLTELCLQLNRRYRQPNTSLRVRPDMPDHLWETVLDNLRTGCGNPALVNESLYASRLQELGDVTLPDTADYGFGGCTETLVQGKSAVDSIGSTYNLLDILETSIATHLTRCGSFDAFLAAFRADIQTTAAQLVAEVNVRQACHGTYRTDPVRTLFTDDCIERCLGYHAGGCRYNFEIVSVYGIANTINSLQTVRALYDGSLGATAAELLDALAANYAGHEALLARIGGLAKFGNNDPEVNTLAASITDFAFDQLRGTRCWRGSGRFLPASIGWTDFVSLGRHLGATPDGRRRGEPLADSTGPTQGTDTRGPTQALLSTAAIAQSKAPGTCVLNLLLEPSAFDTIGQRGKLRALFTTYFAQGGSQLQINVVDEEVLQDAYDHPDRHGDLFVRIAGYNDYYVKQSRDIQAEILERSRHGIES